MEMLWTENAWEDYLYWQNQDKKTLKRVNQLIKDIERSGYEGIGKPEPLRGDLSGWWSRRIDDANRLVYRIENEKLILAACRSHYGDKYGGLSMARDKQGVLVYDFQQERIDIRFGLEEYYGGLHCGETLDVLIDGKWIPTRIEKAADWFLVGIGENISLPGLTVRI